MARAADNYGDEASANYDRRLAGHCRPVPLARFDAPPRVPRTGGDRIAPRPLSGCMTHG